MILFKRVSKSFHRIEGREWALLVLETLGVIVGILLAFELKEWAARRGAAQTGKHQRLERLFEKSEMTVTVFVGPRRYEYIVDAVKGLCYLARAPRRSARPSRCGGRWIPCRCTRRSRSRHSVYQEIMGAGGLV